MRDAFRAGAAGVPGATPYGVRAVSRHVVSIVNVSLGPTGESLHRAVCECGWKGEAHGKKDTARVDAAAHTRSMKAIGE